MENRDSSHHDRLRSLESRLIERAEATARESTILVSTAETVASWETRAKCTQEELDQTRQAMRATLEAAQHAKANSLRLREEFAQQSNTLTDRNRELTRTLAALEQARATAAQCQAQVAELRTALDEQSTKLANAERQRDLLQKNKRTAELQLTQVRRELDRANQEAQVAPELRKRLSELETTLAEKKNQEARQAKEAERLAKTAETLQERLDEVLAQRETLRDELTILRERWSQGQQSAHRDESATVNSQEWTHEMQSALARARRDYEGDLQDHRARLTQVEKALEAKEKALQIAYQNGNDARRQWKEAEKAREAESGGRQNLTESLQSLHMELEAARAQAQRLEARLGDFKSASPE